MCKKVNLEIIKDSPKTYHSPDFIINAEKRIFTFKNVVNVYVHSRLYKIWLK